MFKIRLLVIMLLLGFTALIFGGNKPTGKDFTQFVNPFIGTVGNANTFPGPTLPFAMVQLSPYIKSNKIYGFSHTHNSGSAGGGSGVKGDVLFMPIIGNFNINTKNDFASSFIHRNEEAIPGYYKVFLDDYKISVELTTTTRVDLQKYTFTNSEQATVVLDLGRGEVNVKDGKISGYTSNNIFFIAEFSQPIKNYSFTNENKAQKNSATVKGNNVKGFFRFDVRADKPLLFKVAISPVSVEGAKKNLSAELPGWDFNLTREKAKDAWNKELGKIEIEGGTKDERIIF